MKDLKFRAWDKQENCWGDLAPIWKDTPENLNIMQYTGLKDKNGKEIFESDFVQIEGYGVGIVVFDEAMFQYKPIERDDWKIEVGVVCESLYPIIDSKVEVIGNIYDNPELLFFKKASLESEV